MTLSSIAEELYQHQKSAIELEKITLRNSGLSVDDAYEIQRLCMEKYVADGDDLIGWKMGLTSKAKQQSVGVDEAIFGHLTRSMELEKPELSLSGLIHPRVEPELAFVFDKPLQGPDVMPRDVWLATECVMPAFEIIDSRYKNFSFTLVDVVADNASSAKFYLGPQAFSPYHCQWDSVGVVMKKNRDVVQTGAGAAVLGHPVYSIVEQVRMLHRVGKRIEAGMMVLTGGITEAIYVHEGDKIAIEFDGLGVLSLSVHA